MTSTVANFAITYTQLLDSAGKLIGNMPAFAKDTSVLLNLYYQMVRTRTFDKKAIALQRTGKLGTYPPSNGQEAIFAAIGHALRQEDVLVPYYRDYAAQFQRGVKMSDILSYWGGDERGSQYSDNAQDLPISVPIATQTLHAAGIAFAFQYRKQPRVALTTLGDGGTSEGDFYEAINVAGAWNLPVVFVINNNQWAISVALDKQTKAQTLAQKAIAAGFEGMQVDGNDVLACREVVGQAIEKARAGKGPTLIEAISYRLSDHTTADDATRYQSQETVDAAWKKEPIRRFREFLHQQNLWDEQQEKALLEKCSKEVQEAVDKYLAKPKQPLTSMFDFHYAELPDYFIEQRAIAQEESDYA